MNSFQNVESPARTCAGTFRASDVDKSDITFVVAGKIVLSGEFNTHRCLSSVRRFFPTSKIILSTWEGEPIESLGGLYDTLILSREPGEKPVSIFLRDSPLGYKYNSINLQQFSVHAGMEKVSTSFAARLRSDTYLINDNFLCFYKKWAGCLTKTDPVFRLFQERLLVYRAFTQDPRQGDDIPVYMLSDCFQFGLTADIKKLWDGHQEPFESFNYFEDHPESTWENPARFNHRYNAEQYFFLNLIRKAGLDVKLPEYCFDRSRAAFIPESEKVYAANILIGNNRQLGISYKVTDDIDPCCFTLERLIEIYLQNIDPDNEVCLRYLEREENSRTAAREQRLRQTVKKAVQETKSGVKALCRRILPVYRVNAGVRDRLAGLSYAETERFHKISRQLDMLAAQQKRTQEKINTLKHLYTEKSTAPEGATLCEEREKCELSQHFEEGPF